MGLLKYSETKKPDYLEKFEKLRLYLISKGYDKTKAFIEASKMALNPKPLEPIEINTKTQAQNFVTFVFENKEQADLVRTFFGTIKSGVVSHSKSRLLVDIIKFLVEDKK